MFGLVMLGLIVMVSIVLTIVIITSQSIGIDNNVVIKDNKHIVNDKNKTIIEIDKNKSVVEIDKNKRYVYRPRPIKMPRRRSDLKFEDRFVEAHNFFRREHCAPDLRWNGDLAKTAEIWAQKIARENVMRHPSSSEKSQFGQFNGKAIGQNLAVGIGSISTQGDNYLDTPEDIVTSWQEEKAIPNFEKAIINQLGDKITFEPSLEERKRRARERMKGVELPEGCDFDIEYDYKRHECNPNNLYGHMTQVVWKDSREIGCAQSAGKGGNVFTVCNYTPAGNVIGKYNENVLDPATCN